MDKETIYYYNGRHAVKILHIFNKRGIIEHIEDGFIGSKRKGYTPIKKGELSITYLINCYSIKKKKSPLFQKQKLNNKL